MQLFYWPTVSLADSCFISTKLARPSNAFIYMITRSPYVEELESRLHQLLERVDVIRGRL